MTYLKKFLFIINAKHRSYLIYVFFLMLIGMVLETFSIGLVIPLINTMLQYENTTYQFNEILFYLFGRNFSLIELYVIGLSILLIVFSIKTLFMSYLYWVQYSFAYDVNRNLSQKMYEGYVHLPYSFHLTNNSSSAIKNITNEVANVTGVIIQSLQVATDIFIFIGISCLLLYYEPIGAIGVGLMIGIPVFIFYKLFRERILTWGKQREFNEGNRVKIIQEGIGGIKDIKVLGRENSFFDSYSNYNYKQTRADQLKSFVMALPKQWIEYISIIGIVVLVLVLLFEGANPESIIASLAIFAAAAFRILPSTNRILSGVQFIKYFVPSIDILDNLFKQFDYNNTKATASRELSFSKNIRINDLSFSYPEQENNTLKNVNMCIEKGELVGVIGKSGSGKSTLINILLGLLEVKSGSIYVDDRDVSNNFKQWQKLIGFVSQNIFLKNDSILTNIAFGIPEEQINHERIQKCLKLSNLENFINELPNKLLTKVGERGIRLSGGQLQRIGIARALYENPEIIIFDEATSALDFETEKEVLKSINTLKKEKTIIMITHRIKNLEEFDKIFFMEDGKMIKSGNYNELSKEGILN